ncbi:MAG: tetratricopeptide repeat protein [Calditrichaeota bacterium]|nr:tetratricopeptide repeat protein [Calditrichota bacterium]
MRTGLQIRSDVLNHKRKILGFALSVALGGALLASGCAYYNTFYNAKQYYKKAEEQRLKRRTDRPTQAELENYKKAVEKAGKVIQNYPKSRYVDDAVMLMGKAYYYQNQLGSAQRKFEELLAYFPDSEFAPEAQLWLARCLIAQSQFDQAEKVLKELHSRKKIPGKVRDESYLLLGDLYFNRQDYKNALEEYKKAAKRIGDKKLKAQSYLSLGECASILEQHEVAADAFRRAIKYTDTPELRYKAVFNYGVELKALGKYDEAIKVFERILRDGSMTKFWPDAKYQIAETAYEKGELDYAQRWLEGIIEDHPRTEAAANAYYLLGQIYVHDYSDYKGAKENFDKVRGAYSRAEVVPDAIQFSQDLDKFLQLRELITKQEQQLSKGDTSLVQVGERQRRRLRPGEEWRPDTTLTHRDSLMVLSRLDSLVQDGIKPDSAAVYLAEKDTLLYWIFPPDSLVDVYERVQSNDSLWAEIDRIRREEAQMTAAERRARAAARMAARNKQRGPTIEAATPENVAKNKLKLAEYYLFRFDKPDTALAIYKDILTRYAKTPSAPQALYSYIYILEAVHGDTAAADSFRKQLIEFYPDTPQADACRRQLGLVQPVKKKTDGAEQMYEEAERLLWDENNPKRALDTYAGLVEKYPDSDLVPKALYAAGWVCENKLGANEQAAEIYQMLLDKYPDSPYAQQVKAPLEELKRAKEEAARAAQASTDSTRAPADSAATVVAAADTGGVVADTAAVQLADTSAVGDTISVPGKKKLPNVVPAVNRNTIVEHPDVQAEPVGGLDALQQQLRIPASARNKVLPGTVMVRVLVDERGFVRDVKLITPLEDSDFEMAALRAIRQVRWKPGTLKGKPVRSWVEVPLDFLQARRN